MSNYRFYELYKVSGGSRSELDRDFFNGNSGDGDSLRTVQLLPEQREVWYLEKLLTTYDHMDKQPQNDTWTYVTFATF